MKSRRSLAFLCLAILAVLLFGVGNVAHATPLTTGNILVSDEVFSGPGRVREFTPAGVLVQTFNFPASPPGDGQPRDLIVDSNGNIQIYNGTFTPVLTTLNPAGTGTVTGNTPFLGWSTINNTTYGGIAAFGDFVFATDMATAGAGSPNGIVRFNVNDLSALRFASGPPNGPGDYIDLTIGRDGLLYAQFPGTSPGGNQVDVFDPTTLAFQRRINLGVDLRAIAVDQNGDIFAVALNDNRIFQFDTNGNLLRTVTSIGGFWDIDIDGAGRLVIAAGDRIVLTDRSLSSLNILNVGTISPVGTFVAFVQPPLGPAGLAVPEPASLAPLGIGLAGLLVWRWRKRS
jgi:hypothetical protein